MNHIEFLRNRTTSGMKAIAWIKARIGRKKKSPSLGGNSVGGNLGPQMIIAESLAPPPPPESGVVDYRRSGSLETKLRIDIPSPSESAELVVVPVDSPQVQVDTVQVDTVDSPQVDPSVQITWTDDAYIPAVPISVFKDSPALADKMVQSARSDINAELETLKATSVVAAVADDIEAALDIVDIDKPDALLEQVLRQRRQSQQSELEALNSQHLTRLGRAYAVGELSDSDEESEEATMTSGSEIYAR